MASLTGQTISTTYDSLLKLTDNGPITASFKEITDGLGNSSGVFVKSTGQIKLGNYTTTTSFTGTAAGYLAFTSAGEIITTAIPSGGITSLNALTASTQTFAVGTSGTDFAISSATSTHTFNLPTASAANRGALSSADWTTFNNKQNALTNPVTGTGTTNYVPKFTGSTAIGNSIIFDNGTQVGIGTASPASTLDVSGSITSSSNVRALRFWGGPSVFTSHGAPLHIFSSTIGTSPIARFNNNESTDSSTVTSIWLENYAGYRAELAYTTHLNGSNIYIDNTYSSGNILFNIAGSEKLRIASSGNVGIGTTTPLGVLHISGLGAVGQLYADQYGTAGSNLLLRSARGTQSAPTSTLSGDLLGSIGVRGYGATGFSSGGRAGLYMYAAENFTDTAQGTYLILGTALNGTASRAERMRITDAGNVGIGTTSPGAKLEVYLNDNSLTGAKVTNVSTGVGAAAITNYSNGTASHYFGTLGTAYAGYGVLLANEGFVYTAGQSLSLAADGANSIKFGTGTGTPERMRITSAGNVGIGTSSPNEKHRSEHARLA